MLACALIADMATQDENACAQPDETDSNSGVTRGLQNITNQMKSATLKNSVGQTKRSVSSISQADAADSWLTGKVGVKGGVPRDDSARQGKEDIMAKYAHAQPPSGMVLHDRRFHAKLAIHAKLAMLIHAKSIAMLTWHP